VSELLVYRYIYERALLMQNTEYYYQGYESITCVHTPILLCAQQKLQNTVSLSILVLCVCGQSHRYPI